MHSSTSRAPSPSPRARGSTSRSRSLATSSAWRTQNTQPAGRPSTSAIHTASRAGSCSCAKSATICATSASNSAFQPYSCAYSSPWRSITQPRSPGARRAEHDRAARGGAGSSSRRTSASAATSRRRSASPRPFSFAPVSLDRAPVEQREVGLARGVSRASWRRPSTVERSRATSPRCSSRASSRLRWPASMRIRRAQHGDLELLFLRELEQHARLGERVRRARGSPARACRAGRCRSG